MSNPELDNKNIKLDNTSWEIPKFLRIGEKDKNNTNKNNTCLLYTSPSPRD